VTGVSSDSMDRWSRWLLEHRFGGDAAQRERVLPQLLEFRDQVLAAAKIRPGDVVLDVGCGDGLLGVGALDAVGESGQVVFSDISSDLLNHCRAIVAELGLLDRSRFVHTGLPELASVDSESVDVAMTRSVLIYVDDKRLSFAALHRVLRPGGRVSMFEPINRFGHPEPPSRLLGLDVTGVEPMADQVKAAFRGYQPDSNPMVDFDERDLIVWAEDAGFGEVHLNYHVDIDQQPIEMTWPVLLRSSPNPLVPPLADVLAQALTLAEREVLEQRLQEQLSLGGANRRFASAYLMAIR
jgi:arsenite methyltransferase